MRHLRRFYWQRVRRYAYEICDACGRPVARSCPSYWLAPDSVWLAVEGAYVGVRCIPCFTTDARERGRPVSWRAVEEAR